VARGNHANVDTAFVAARESIPSLVAPQGTIVIISSVATTRAIPGFAAYITSKSALLGLVKSLAVDCGPAGVRVNGICPGLVRTPMADELNQAVVDETSMSLDEVYANAIRRTPLGRVARPEDIAELVWFLSSRRRNRDHRLLCHDAFLRQTRSARKWCTSAFPRCSRVVPLRRPPR
jgi:NAD(P)-dependent dehydrogenase (short-subunit alcohol dehydrogenase family)